MKCSFNSSACNLLTWWDKKCPPCPTCWDKKRCHVLPVSRNHKSFHGRECYKSREATLKKVNKKEGKQMTDEDNFLFNVSVWRKFPDKDASRWMKRWRLKNYLKQPFCDLQSHLLHLYLVSLDAMNNEIWCFRTVLGNLLQSRALAKSYSQSHYLLKEMFEKAWLFPTDHINKPSLYKLFCHRQWLSC